MALSKRRCQKRSVSASATDECPPIEGGVVDLPIRLLHVMGVHAGGISRLLGLLDLELLRDPQIDTVDLVCCTQPHLERPTATSHARGFYAVSGDGKRVELRTAVRAFVTIWRVIRMRGVNIACVHSPHMLIALSAMLACLLLRVPYVLYYHGSRRRAHVRNAKSRLLSFLPAVFSRRRVVVTPAGRYLLGERACVIPPCVAVPPGNAGSTPVVSLETRRRPLVLYPARFVPAKGQADIVEMERLFRTQRGIPEHEVLMVGHHEDPCYVRGVVRKVHQYGLEDTVTVGGYLEADTLLERYMDSSLIVFPTYEEGFGTIIAEAGVLGVPTVAYRAGGLDSVIIHGLTGMLVPCGSIYELARTTALLLCNMRLRRELGKNARRMYADQYSVPAVASRFAEMLRECIRS